MLDFWCNTEVAQSLKEKLHFWGLRNSRKISMPLLPLCSNFVLPRFVFNQIANKSVSDYTTQNPQSHVSTHSRKVRVGTSQEWLVFWVLWVNMTAWRPGIPSTAAWPADDTWSKLVPGTSTFLTSIWNDSVSPSISEIQKQDNIGVKCGWLGVLRERSSLQGRQERYHRKERRENQAGKNTRLSLPCMLLQASCHKGDFCEVFYHGHKYQNCHVNYCKSYHFILKTYTHAFFFLVCPYSFKILA